jgi:hypothetical protein
MKGETPPLGLGPGDALDVVGDDVAVLAAELPIFEQRGERHVMREAREAHPESSGRTAGFLAR